MLRKQNIITSILFLLLFSTFISSEKIYFTFINLADANVWMYVSVISFLSLIGYLFVYKEKQSQNSFQISLLFMLLGLFTIVSSMFKEFPLGAIIGQHTQLFNGIVLFVIVPAIIKVVDYLKSKNDNIIENMVAIFIIARAIFELIFLKTITVSYDFMAFTGVFGLIIIAPSVNIKNITKSEILRILGVITATLMILLSDNRTSIAMFLIIFPTVWGFSYLIKNTAYKSAIKIIPVSLLIFSTLFILFGKYMDIFSYNNITNTLWQRGGFLQSAISSFDLKSLLIGNGWGSSNIFILNDSLYDGLTLTKNNNITSVAGANFILGSGINHIHNELFEYLIGGGIVALTIYILIWYKLSIFAKENIVVIALLATLSCLYSTWFTFTADIVLFAIMIGLIAHNTTKAEIKYEKITKPYVALTSAILFLFGTFIYTPYINKFAYKIPSELFYGTWYSGDKTGFKAEKIIIRAYAIRIINKAYNKKPIYEWEATYLIDALDTLKKKAIEGNKEAIIELPYIYNKLFIQTKSSDIIEQIRQREYENWATVTLLAGKNFPNRFDLTIDYLAWHTDRNFDTAVDEVTKRLLKTNPNNAVALYWRGKLFIKHNNDLGHDMMAEAFRQNITRYQRVHPEIYNKYKHLLDPKYR